MMDNHIVAELNTRISTKAADLLRVPGVLAVEPGYRIRAGKITDEPVISVFVEQKFPIKQLPKTEDLRSILGAADVDVVQATPLQALFAQPERYGLDPKTLRIIEDRFGSPYSSDAIGPRAIRRLEAARRTRGRDGIPDHITYEPPPGVSLEPALGPVRLRCHASPDAGWQELKAFIEKVSSELITGMYELTAPHIGDLLVDHLRTQRASFQLTLDEGENIGSGIKKDDRREDTHLRMFEKAFGDRFSAAYALTKSEQQTFETDYHIKLAVRDGSALWMSSGSWQSSNQPPLDPLGHDAESKLLGECNREWHLVIEHGKLAANLGKYLEWDLATAKRMGSSIDAVSLQRMANLPDVFVSSEKTDAVYKQFFPPKEISFEADNSMRLLPLLTPDNFIDGITREIAKAKETLYVQNQSLSFLTNEDDQDPRYTEFMKILAEKSHSLKDFRLILRKEFIFSPQAALANYKLKGFNIERIRLQNRCHNKGVLIDGQVVIVGSHNFTNAGTTANRDASMVIQHPAVFKYYEKIFLHDWEIANTEPPLQVARLALPNEPTPPGMRRVKFSEAFHFD